MKQLAFRNGASIFSDQLAILHRKQQEKAQTRKEKNLGKHEINHLEATITITQNEHKKNSAHR